VKALEHACDEARRGRPGAGIGAALASLMRGAGRDA
jgi:hypothetical protein